MYKYKIDIMNEHIKLNKKDNFLVKILFNKIKEIFPNVKLKKFFVYFDKYEEYYISYYLLKDLKKQLISIDLLTNLVKQK